MASSATAPREATPICLNVKEALAKLDQWSLHVPRQNKFTKKLEAPILFNNDLACVQIGTPKQPVWCGKGLQRWSQGDGKFLTVDNPKSVEWAYLANAGNSFQRKRPGGKLQAELTLHEWDTEGTQGYYAYNFLKGIYERVIQGLVYGVPDLTKPPNPDGTYPLVSVTQMAMPEDPVARDLQFRRSMQPPVRDPQTGKDGKIYAPTVRTKVRYSVKGSGPSECVGLDVDVLDGGEPKATRRPVSIERQMELFKARSRAVYVIKINPLQFKRNEINLTIDVIKVLVAPLVKSAFQNVQIHDDGDEEMGDAGGDTDDEVTGPSGGSAGAGAPPVTYPPGTYAAAAATTFRPPVITVG